MCTFNSKGVPVDIDYKNYAGHILGVQPGPIEWQQSNIPLPFVALTAQDFVAAKHILVSNNYRGCCFR